MRLLDVLDKAAAVRLAPHEVPQYGSVQINKELLGQLVRAGLDTLISFSFRWLLRSPVASVHV